MLPKPSMLGRSGPPPQQAEKTARARRAGGAEKSQSDEVITPERSLEVSAFLAGIMIISEDLSSLPLILYQRFGRVKTRAVDTPYYELLHDRPNPEHSSMVFRELMPAHLIAWGNFYGQLIWNEAGDITEIWPLRPDRMNVTRVEGKRVYIYSPLNGPPVIFLQDEILHIPGFGFDGLVGYSLVSLARNAIGLSLSAEKFGAKFFANGAIPGLVIKVPDEMSDTAYEHFRDSWEAEHRASEHAHKIAIVEGDTSVEKIGIPLDDAQFLETRKFQVEEIARILRITPHMIGAVEKSTSWGAGIDSQEQGYVNHTLRPWAVRIEENLRLQVLPEAMWPTYYYEHLMDAFLRGDIATRYEAYVKALLNGMMSHNEVRAKENMNPFKGGDSYWMQAQMTRIGGPDTGNATASFEPLWRDAIARIVKRETNDLQGALRRFKGADKRLQAWAKTFYGKDHPAFIRRQLQPILEAEQRLFQLDRWDEIEASVEAMLSGRLADVLETNPEELLAGLDSYAEAISGVLLDRLLPVSIETVTAEEVIE